MKRRVACLMSLLLVAGLLQGCWNYRELDKMRFVAGCAIDKGTDEKYRLTIDLLTTFTAGKDKPVESLFITVEGETIIDAGRKLAKLAANKLYWPHCQILILSKDVAQESILPIMDFFMRDAEPRLTLELLVSEEETAAEVLKQKPLTMSISSFEIDTILENNQKNLATTEIVLLYEAYNTLAGNGKALTLPACRLEEQDGVQTAVIGGIAVFKRDRLIGFLTPEESKEYLFLTNAIEGGILPVQADTGNTIAALEIFANKTTLKPTSNNGAVEFAIHTETDVDLAELNTTQDYVYRDGKGPEDLKAMAERQLSERLLTMVQSVQDRFGVDIFGFGDVLHRSDPAAWRQVSPLWDELFKTIKVSVSSTIHIRNAASMNTPVEVGDR